MKVFLFDNSSNEVIINEPEILLIREFSALWDNERNKTKQDLKGTKKTRAFREFTYIWLMLDWASPYSDYAEADRHQECIKDANLTEEEWNDPLFRAACRKYKELQESSRALKLLRSAQNVVDKLSDYFNFVSLEERDPVTGKPIFKAKDVMAELQNVSKTVEELKTQEYLYKKELQESSELMGDVKLGFMD